MRCDIYIYIYVVRRQRVKGLRVDSTYGITSRAVHLTGHKRVSRRYKRPLDSVG